MEFSVEQMVELGFRQVFIPQMKTSCPWFTPEMRNGWKCALRVAEFLADTRKDGDSAPFDITAVRIIRCWDYFGGVAEKTEVEVL